MSRRCLDTIGSDNSYLRIHTNKTWTSDKHIALIIILIRSKYNQQTEIIRKKSKTKYVFSTETRCAQTGANTFRLTKKKDTTGSTDFPHNIGRQECNRGCQTMQLLLRTPRQGSRGMTKEMSHPSLLNVRCNGTPHDRKQVPPEDACSFQERLPCFLSRRVWHSLSPRGSNASTALQSADLQHLN